MSLILDALRRRPRSTGGATPARRADQADTVLATLGYAKRRSFEAGLLILGTLIVIVIGAAAWGSYTWYTLTPPSQPRRAQASSLPQPGSLPNARLQPPPPPVVVPPAPSGTAATLVTPPLASKPAIVQPPAPLPPRSAPASSPPRVESGAPSRVPTQPVSVQPRTVANPDSIPPADPPPPLVVRSSRLEVPANEPLPPPASPSVGASRTPATRVTTGSQPDHFRLALYYHRAGDFENALLHYRALLEQNELNAEAHNNLGLLYQEKGLIEDAIKQFERAISIDPQYVKAHNNLGVVWLRTGKLDGAGAEFRAALAEDEKNVESLTNLAVVTRQTGHPDEARALLQRALTREPRYAAAHYNMGLAYEESGDIEGALRHYRSFLDNSTPDQATLAGEVRKRLTALTTKGK